MGSLIDSSVPLLCDDSIHKVPPMALKRSRIAINPNPLRPVAAWAACASKPAPSSRIAQCNTRSFSHARIQTFLALACLTALDNARSEEYTSELQSLTNLVCRLLLQQK